VRVATYNIRNGRAPDPASFWWTRRRALAGVIRRVDADVWGMQEVYGFQRRYLERRVLPASEWASCGDGRNDGGGGEQVPVFHRRSQFTTVGATTMWFGPDPERAGSTMPGADRPRIATLVELETIDGDRPLRVVNLHLDSESVERRAASLEQLLGWLGRGAAMPVIVLGDFNGPMSDPGYHSFLAGGLRPALPDDAGPTSNGFGRDLASQRQIDHVFVSPELEVRSARIDREAGHASDHYPVVVDLAW
jgi:endonuclease/exonuclease/phosphatase family metal-dependent hydrolase